MAERTSFLNGPGGEPAPEVDEEEGDEAEVGEESESLLDDGEDDEEGPWDDVVCHLPGYEGCVGPACHFYAEIKDDKDLRIPLCRDAGLKIEQARTASALADLALASRPIVEAIATKATLVGELLVVAVPLITGNGTKSLPEIFEQINLLRAMFATPDKEPTKEPSSDPLEV